MWLFVIGGIALALSAILGSNGATPSGWKDPVEPDESPPSPDPSPDNVILVDGQKRRAGVTTLDGEVPAAPPPTPAVSTPQAGERWQRVYALNRELGWLEKAAAESAFSNQMPDQTLESLSWSESAPWKGTVISRYITDQQRAMPKVISKADVTATLVSSRKL